MLGIVVLAAGAGSARAGSNGMESVPHVVPAPVVKGAASKVHAHNPAAVLELHVGLQVRHSARLDNLIAGRVVLTKAQYAARYAPTAAQAARLAAWLKSRGLKVTGAASQNLWVTAQGSTAQVARAFGVSISDYRYHGRTFYSSNQAPTLPASLRVVGIQGLSDYARPVTFSRHATHVKGAGVDVVPNTSAPFCPSVFRSAYSVNHDASGRTIDMVLWGAALPQSDLGLFNAKCGTSLSVGSGANQVSFVAVDGASSDTSALGEVGLDVENALGVAPAAHLNYYLANITGDIYDAEQAAVDDSSSSVISNSWGASKTDLDGVDPTFENILQQGAALGKTILFSTGDNSQITYPATSPYVVAVGGTSLSTDGSNNWSGESTWSGGGRGCSAAEPKPSWEVGISCAGRAEPDVSADADPSTGAWDCYSGSCAGAGGTSLSAPLWAGVLADWNSQIHAADGGVGVGFAAPVLWRTSPTCAPTVISSNVTSNDNGTTIEKWPGANPTLGSGGCTITVHQPSGDIDLVGGTAGVDSWGLSSVTGFTAANVVQVGIPNCLGVGAVGSVTLNRPRCSNASTVFESGRSTDIAWFNTTPFHDIITGATGGVSAARGWDNATGWGSPIYTQLVGSVISQAINFPAIGTHTYGGPTFTITPTASSGLALTVASTTSSTCSAASNSPNPGWNVTIIHAGTCSIQASQAGDSKYAAATMVSRSFTINKATQTITFNAITTKTLGTPPFGVSPSSTGGLPVSVVSNTTGVCTVSSHTVTLVGPGTCSLKASQAGDSNHNAALPVTRTFGVVTPDLIKDGGFEAPIKPAHTDTIYKAGQKIGPWSVTAGSVDLLNTLWQNAAGVQSIDLAGSKPGTITQRVTLAYTGTYHLSFKFAGNPDGAPVIKHMQVSAKAPTWGAVVSASKAFSTTGRTHAAMGWKVGTLTFAGKAGDVVTITFHDTDAATPYGMALDGVTLIAG